MNAVVDARHAVSVALLGPADPAREQLRLALVTLGAELVFEGEVREGARLAGHAPQVLIVNLEPGVEDDLDALQDLLDDPDTAVVFNEGEVSSQLTGWDLARWARHLAAKVLGVRDTLPPPPTGAERLPDLALMPEPGRPTSPSQQHDHLQFDDYAEEALGHSDEVPTSPRLELEATGPAPDLHGLDFDFSPVQSADSGADAPEAAAIESDSLESLDLSTLFEQDLGQLSPEDMLLKLQQVMGLEPGPLASATGQRSEYAGTASESAIEPETPVVAETASDDGGEILSLSLVDVPPTSDAPLPELDFDWGSALEATSEEVDTAETDALASAPASVASPGGWDTAPNPAAADIEEGGVAVALADAPGSPSIGLSFDPVEFEFGLDETASATPPDAGFQAADAAVDPSAPDNLLDFDFSRFDSEAEDVSLQVDQGDSIGSRVFEAAVGDAGLELDFVASEADEDIVRLAAELDARSSLPAAADLPDLEFDFSLREPDALAADAAPASERPEVKLPGAAVNPSVGVAPATASSGANTGFGELSLQPMNDGFIDPGVKASEAPVRNFDFSHLTLSLEPIEDSAPASSPHVQPDVAVSTMRDGAWLRDLGEHEPSLSTAPAVPVTGAAAAVGPQPVAADEPSTFDFSPASTTLPPPLPAAAVAAFSTAAPPLAPLSQGVSRVVVLCASIGGPDAVRGFLSGIPAGFPALFVVVQHLENGYFERLAQQLQKASKLPVRVPMAGLSARDGEVLVVASGSRFLLASDGEVDLAEQDQPSRYRPCIDDVLIDIADAFGPHAHAVIFSGMAADAVEGSVYLTRQGGEVWAQDPESCVVSSMVDGARARGVVEFIGSPRELAEHCVRRFGGAN